MAHALQKANLVYELLGLAQLRWSGYFVTLTEITAFICVFVCVCVCTWVLQRQPDYQYTLPPNTYPKL